MEILQKPSQKRFNEELLFVKEAFSDVKFFEKMESELEHEDFLKLFKQLQLREHGRGDIVFNYGNYSSRC